MPPTDLDDLSIHGEFRNSETFNMLRNGHLHLDDWSLIVTALESLVIGLESDGYTVGNLIERAEALRKDIKTFILEYDESI